jgi:hypothetical protein
VLLGVHGGESDAGGTALKAGNREQGIENRELRAGSWEREVGSWELASHHRSVALSADFPKTVRNEDRGVTFGLGT